MHVTHHYGMWSVQYVSFAATYNQSMHNFPNFYTLIIKSHQNFGMDFNILCCLAVYQLWVSVIFIHTQTTGTGHFTPYMPPLPLYC